MSYRPLVLYTTVVRFLLNKYVSVSCTNALHGGVTITKDGLVLKTLDTIGNCQRPVFSLGGSTQMHKITKF